MNITERMKYLHTSFREELEYAIFTDVVVDGGIYHESYLFESQKECIIDLSENPLGDQADERKIV